MKSLLVLAASTLVLAGCTAGAEPTERARLDCPQKEGELSRTGVAADGKSCTYRTAAGDEINLQLIATGGNPQGVLDRIEAEITPAAQAATVAAADKADAAEASAKVAEEAERQAQAAARQVEREFAGGRVSVEVNEAADGSGSKGETTTIRLPGIRINAEDEKADVRIGDMHINAQEDQTVVSMRRDVRLKGQAFAREKRGLRATYVYTGAALPQDVGAVGYEAGGPKSGPLTVAVVRAKSADTGDGELFEDIKRLVRRNGGV